MLDIYTLSFGHCVPLGFVRIYQAKYSCLSYNLYMYTPCNKLSNYHFSTKHTKLQLNLSSFQITSSDASQIAPVLSTHIFVYTCFCVRMFHILLFYAILIPIRALLHGVYKQFICCVSVIFHEISYLLDD